MATMPEVEALMSTLLGMEDKGLEVSEYLRYLTRLIEVGVPVHASLGGALWTTQTSTPASLSFPVDYSPHIRLTRDIRLRFCVKS